MKSEEKNSQVFLSELERGRRLCIISTEPWICKILLSRKPLFIPEDLYCWALAYVYDVMSVLRSRRFRISLIVNSLCYRFLGDLYDVMGLDFKSIIEKLLRIFK